MRHIILLLLILWPALVFGWPGKVVHVSDGDTVTVLTEDKRQVRVRLYGVDTPEKGQARGRQASEFTKDLAALRIVDVQEMDVDRYGRLVGRITLPDGRVLNAELVASGWAWVYQDYCTTAECKAWLALEEHARRERLGLWQDRQPVPPWEWRRAKREGGTSEYSKKDSGTLVFHGNVRSRVFHAPGCRHYDCKNCTETFPSREAALKSGYKPCGICKP